MISCAIYSHSAQRDGGGAAKAATALAAGAAKLGLPTAREKHKLSHHVNGIARILFVVFPRRHKNIEGSADQHA